MGPELERRPGTVELDADHPGFRDAGYRERREAIARLARSWTGGPAPPVEYTPEEHAVWRVVRARLRELHPRWACREVLRAAERLDLDPDRIPQLEQVNRRLEPFTGFRMVPVAGLVSPRAFLEHLGRGLFLSTQYVRHERAPFYTPEPDVLHELIGHAATLADPVIAELSRTIGRAAARSNDERVRALERLYWYTLEFGVVEERGAPRALGAGLLSSVHELERLPAGVELRPWSLEAVVETPYDPTGYQPHLFLAPSFEQLVGEVLTWVGGSP